MVGKFPLESKRNGETPHNTRSLSGPGHTSTIRVPSRLPATKKWTESCSSTPFFWNCLFSPREIPAQSSAWTLQKVWACICVCNTNQSKAISRSRSIPTRMRGIFTCDEKLHQSTNLLTFQCITNLPNGLHAVGPGETHGLPAHTLKAGLKLWKVHVIFFVLFSDFLPKPCARWTRNKEFTWCSHSRKFSSAKNFVKCDCQAVRQDFIFVKSRSSLVCSLLVKNISQEFNLVKNCSDESDEIKFLTKIYCYTVPSQDHSDQYRSPWSIF